MVGGSDSSPLSFVMSSRIETRYSVSDMSVKSVRKIAGKGAAVSLFQV